MALSAYSVEKLRSVAGGLAKGTKICGNLPKIPAGITKCYCGKVTIFV